MASHDPLRPNIVFVLADDQGYWAMGCAGNHEIQTPNLDRLAAMGLRFENFFCASPVCSPARASILTGRIPSQHGVHDWIRKGNLNSERIPEAGRDDDREIEYLKGLTAYTEILAAHGYVCGISGKWHLGDSLHPQKGFAYWHLFPYGGGSYYSAYIIRDGRLEQDPRYLTNVITEGGLKFLDMQAQGETPFYLSVHYTAPHSPWNKGEHPEELTGLYKDCPFETCPVVPGGHPWQINSAPRGTGARRHELLSGYFGAITGLDRGVGQLLDKLAEMGVLENTLFIFSSDNGMNMGHHGIWGKGNGTFPQNMYDTSVKVPMIIARPGHVPQGVVSDHLLSHYDLFPTLLDYLGLENPVAEGLPGSSFAPLLRGDSLAERDHVIVFDEYGPVRMIRTREWKYVHRYPYGPHELYDLVHDPNETHNLVQDPAYQRRVAELRGALEAWFVRYVDPDVDGVREPVTGKGQVDLAGVKNGGRRAYEGDWWYIDEHGNKLEGKQWFYGRIMEVGPQGGETMGREKLSHRRPMKIDRFLYGAAYYPEHWTATEREQDVTRMVEAGFNCVRMGEFAWAYFEPEEGRYQFELFDEAIARLGEKGIMTILGTPTATPPRWLTLAHPEVLRVDADGTVMQHGSRQHVCPSSEVFRDYSRRITQALAEHFADNPYVIGWQTDNELNCHFSECHCPACQAEFRAFLRRKYEDDIEALNAAWGNTFWSLTYRDFDEISTPRNGTPAYANPGHLLDYYRFIAWNTARFQHEQVVILRQAQPRWFITHNGTFAHVDYRGLFGQDLDFLGYDVYPFFETDPQRRPYTQAFNLDHTRAWSGNFFLLEQQSGPGGQGTYLHDTPEPGEVRRMAYTSIAHGADSLLFFRWRTCRYGAEEYWCGIFDHDNVPRRRYEEVRQLGAELQRIGPEILGTSVRVDVGIAAADVEVYDAHSTLSLGLPSPQQVARRLHGFFMRSGYTVGCVHPLDDLGGLKVFIIPHWALFDPAWIPGLQAFAEGGGILIVGARTATRDWHNRVIAETPPGVLRALAGVKVAEYGRQNTPDKRPLTIRIYPDGGEVHTVEWYEILENLPGTSVIGRWEGRHLRMKIAVTLRKVGKGAVIYAGTYLTSQLMEALLPTMSRLRADLAPLWPMAPEDVQVVVREGDGRRLWFLINDSDRDLMLTSPPKGEDLITGRPTKSRWFLGRNEVSVIKETL